GQNPYLEAAISAARRGLEVRILFDSYWYNTEGDSDNDEMAEYINAVAESENLTLKAALIDLDSLGAEKIHNKAVIVDGESVLISSVNWNENSPSYNREAGVILSGGGVGEYYEEVFDYDWERRQGAESGMISSVFSEDEGSGLKCLLAFFVIALFAGIYVKRRR
ncbi:MAG: phospholipase D-like domain-containing protein, partial [Methanomicrobium sp.]|nr:phospholipase D-like domain-containing protein [Methanomicrobium sp.]